MTRFGGAMLVTVFVLGPGGLARADADKDSTAILDKAIKAMGGEKKLEAVKAASWKAKGKISVNGTEGTFTIESTVQGLDQYRGEFEGDFGGMKVNGVTVLNGAKGWRSFAGMNMEMEKDGVANEKRTVYLQVIPTTLVALKGKGFKVKAAGEEKVNGQPAVGIKVTGPEGKDFTIFFDKKSGLPVKQVAKVTGFDGNEFTQESTFSTYKEFDGIKKATKIVHKRDGDPFMDLEITDFKVLKKVDAKKFDEPK